tara:strand:- start:305 stop:730 length:426 start_codon:yes stop_codon:yes gene_type:complete
MKEIITALLIWIGANTTYNVDVPLPNVYFMDQTQMNHLYYKHHEPIGELHGFYNLEKDFIVLRDTWDRRDAWHLSVLLHELIHYVQDMNNIQYECNMEMEKDSWPLQKKYLLEVHNYRWEYDGLWHMMVSNCPDIYNGAVD